MNITQSSATVSVVSCWSMAVINNNSINTTATEMCKTLVLGSTQPILMAKKPAMCCATRTQWLSVAQVVKTASAKDVHGFRRYQLESQQLLQPRMRGQ